VHCRQNTQRVSDALAQAFSPAKVQPEPWRVHVSQRRQNQRALPEVISRRADAMTPTRQAGLLRQPDHHDRLDALQLNSPDTTPTAGPQQRRLDGEPDELLLLKVTSKLLC
jgi:hypothetical protein